MPAATTSASEAAPGRAHRLGQAVNAAHDVAHRLLVNAEHLTALCWLVGVSGTTMRQGAVHVGHPFERAAGQFADAASEQLAHLAEVDGAEAKLRRHVAGL